MFEFEQLRFKHELKHFDHILQLGHDLKLGSNKCRYSHRTGSLKSTKYRYEKASKTSGRPLNRQNRYVVFERHLEKRKRQKLFACTQKLGLYISETLFKLTVCSYQCKY